MQRKLENVIYSAKYVYKYRQEEDQAELLPIKACFVFFVPIDCLYVCTYLA